MPIEVDLDNTDTEAHHLDGVAGNMEGDIEGFSAEPIHNDTLSVTSSDTLENTKAEFVDGTELSSSSSRPVKETFVDGHVSLEGDASGVMKIQDTVSKGSTDRSGPHGDLVIKDAELLRDLTGSSEVFSLSSVPTTSPPDDTTLDGVLVPGSTLSFCTTDAYRLWNPPRHAQEDQVCHEKILQLAEDGGVTILRPSPAEAEGTSAVARNTRHQSVNKPTVLWKSNVNPVLVRITRQVNRSAKNTVQLVYKYSNGTLSLYRTTSEDTAPGKKAWKVIHDVTRVRVTSSLTTEVQR